MSAQQIAWHLLQMAGATLLLCLILLLAGGLLYLASNYFWRQAQNTYMLGRLLWGLNDLRKHGQVFPRPDPRHDEVGP